MDYNAREATTDNFPTLIWAISGFVNSCLGEAACSRLVVVYILEAEEVNFSNRHRSNILPNTTPFTIEPEPLTRSDSSTAPFCQYAMDDNFNHGSYSYTPLKLRTDIRLLTLQQGSGDDLITCSLKHVGFAQKPKYEALSYCWGPSTYQKRLQLNGHSILVRNNLWSALRHLRFPDKDRTIWVDALCIDQSNVTERNHQVGLMGKIYRDALEVVAWLGCENENSNVAMSYLQNILKKEECKAAELEALIQLCNREYWRRMWIIQECGLAFDLRFYCGHQSVDWRAFEPVVKLRPRLPAFDKSAAYPVIIYPTVRRMRKQEVTLVILMSEFIHQACKILGTLSMRF